MDKAIVEKAAAVAAKTLYAELVAAGEEKTFRARLDFEVSLKRGEAHTRSNPQKARPWALVQVLLSKLNAVSGEAAVEAWLEEGVKEAQLLDSDTESDVKKRVETSIKKLLPSIQEERPGNVTITKKDGVVVEVPVDADPGLLKRIDFPVKLAG